jgi:hypothetical protein
MPFFTFTQVYACLRNVCQLKQRVFTHVHAAYDTFTYGLRMFTENIFPCAILACCRSDPETGTLKTLARLRQLE